MGREALLRQKREFDQAMKDLMQRYKEPDGIKYELQNESGGPGGFVEYSPKNDMLVISATGTLADIPGGVLKSLRDILNRILED